MIDLLVIQRNGDSSIRKRSERRTCTVALSLDLLATSDRNGAAASDGRLRFIEYLFSRHKAIQVSISELLLERRGSTSARITIDKLITNDGDSVTPTPAWKQARLAIVKKGEH